MTGKRSLACLVLALFLGGCPTVDLGEDLAEPGVCHPDITYFKTQIWPNYLAPTASMSCVGQAGCHAADTGRSALRLETNPDDAALTRNYDVAIRFVNCSSPDASPLLTKPEAGIESHGGGDIFPMGDPKVALFEAWFQQ
jgi:hypothetical protein